jgi:SAM-dependent methyltransferase
VTQQLDPQAIKAQQREQWGRAAAGWRKHDERLRETTSPVTRRLLQLAAIAPGHRVLDIASGTGEPALPAAEIAGPDGFVLLTDQAEEMLAVAREKAQARELHNVEFRLVDGEELSVDPGSFDAVLCRWGIMFMPEPRRCLQQAHRALKPGGRIALATWGPLERNPFLALPMGILRKHYAGPPLPDPAAPGGVFSFADRAKLEATFIEAGFEQVAIEELELPMAVFDSGEECWQYQREFAGPLAALFSRLSPSAQEAASREVISAAPRGDPQGKVSLNGLALLSSATK